MFNRFIKFSKQSLILSLLIQLLSPISYSYGDYNSLQNDLMKLVVKERDYNIPRYNRAYFGKPWEDVDKNKCDTRNDILKRDLTQITYKYSNNNCIVKTGILKDPYSNETINFTQGYNTSLEVQIDHVIPLAQSWREGAYKWSDEKRVEFANDPDNLLAVKGSLNSSKSDKEITSWQPPYKNYLCTYVEKQIKIKIKYNLETDKKEFATFKNIIKTCK